jgi:hypothetical protein
VVVHVVEDRSCGGDEVASSEVDQVSRLAATNSLTSESCAHLPLTGNGEGNLDALPKPDFAKCRSEFIAPRHEVERSLCLYWQDLLKIESIGIHDDFWALGGQSLLAMRVCNFVRTKFDVELKLSKMFANPSVAPLAEHISLELDVRNRARSG